MLSLSLGDKETGRKEERRRGDSMKKQDSNIRRQLRNVNSVL